MRRAYTQGFVSKHGGKWRAAVNWQGEDGRQHRLTKTTGVRCYPDRVDEETGEVTPDNRGRASAETALRRWRDELVASEEERSCLEEASCDTTFAEYAELYVMRKELSRAVRPVTIRGYRSHISKIRGTEIGDARLRDVTPKLIVAWEQGMAADGLSSTTLSHIHVFAKQVFTYACKMGDLTLNPFDRVDAPRRRVKPVNALSAREVARLNRALVGFGPSPLAVGVRIALSTGMRQGEICALRWSDVDLEGCSIRISHSLSRSAGRYVLSSPKTESSLRNVPFGEGLLLVLTERKQAMIADREEFGMDWDDSLFVIGSPISGTWYSPQVLGHEWHALARAVGLVGTQGVPPRFHDLRHTFATLAISSTSGNLDVKTVGSILGHSNAAMTLNVYADALADSKREGMEAMDRIMLSNGDESA